MDNWWFHIVSLALFASITLDADWRLPDRFIQLGHHLTDVIDTPNINFRVAFLPE